ncbi:hypothetical protein A2U01_0098021, partial [Trifolium medium]|nr:hypothetical protein [Trifolium medium]
MSKKRRVRAKNHHL